MTSTLSPTLQAERRSWHYWFSDGLSSLLTSAGCLLFAFFLLHPQQRPVSPLRTALSLAALLLYGVILLRQRQILDWLKTRITYPRTGYVSPPYFAQEAEQSRDIPVIHLLLADLTKQEQALRVETDRRRRFWFILAFGLAAAFVVLYVRNPWICSSAGLLFAAAIWFASRHEQQLSWIILGGFPFVFMSTAFYLRHFSVGPERIVGGERMGYFLAGSGLLFLVDGAASLIRFLLRNPRPSSTTP